MKAHSLPSSEANSTPPPHPQKKRGGKKQTLQTPSKAGLTRAHLYVYRTVHRYVLEYFSEMMPRLEPRLKSSEEITCFKLYVHIAQSGAKSHLWSPL